MQQHTESIVGNITWILLQIYVAFQQWKNFENPLRINKVIGMNSVYYFFGDTVYINKFATSDNSYQLRRWLRRNHLTL